MNIKQKFIWIKKNGIIYCFVWNVHLEMEILERRIQKLITRHLLHSSDALGNPSLSSPTPLGFYSLLVINLQLQYYYALMSKALGLFVYSVLILIFLFSSLQWLFCYLKNITILKNWNISLFIYFYNNRII